MKNLFIHLILVSIAIVQINCYYSTFKKIQKKSEITLGVYFDQSPYSFYNNRTHRFTGYSVDICHKVINYIKNKLHKKFIIIKYKVINNQIPSSNRFDLLLNGSYDLECGVTTNTKTRLIKNFFFLSC